MPFVFKRIEAVQPNAGLTDAYSPGKVRRVLVGGLSLEVHKTIFRILLCLMNQADASLQRGTSRVFSGLPDSRSLTDSANRSYCGAMRSRRGYGCGGLVRMRTLLLVGTDGSYNIVISSTSCNGLV